MIPLGKRPIRHFIGCITGDRKNLCDRRRCRSGRASHPHEAGGGLPDATTPAVHRDGSGSRKNG
ncbi:hypothetical protein SCFA_1570003 [anaerobic digester metagenome]|uniref:Uncharacterized protein n=1 Tax=anaerobic digester metagenome TaxID=1263854 RepID=A0A485LXR6_9ZZZZ